MRDRAAPARRGAASGAGAVLLRLRRDRRAHGRCWPPPSRPSRAPRPRGRSIIAQRADIVDRKGRILATNLETHSLYAQPPIMIEPARARELAAIFPDLDAERLLESSPAKRKFLWIKRKISPEQMQAVHDIGDPGLLFGPREMRLYPNGRAGRACPGRRELRPRGRARRRGDRHRRGREGLRRRTCATRPAAGAPLELSLDLTCRRRRTGADGRHALMNAKGAAAS
jgi:cell division protein FtsI (penicillin-binding protein 3)